MKKRTRSLVATLSALVMLVSALAAVGFTGTAAEATEVYPTANGDASKLMPGTTIRLEDAEKKNPTPSVWKENADGTLTYTKKGYNAIFFDTGKALPTNYRISGKVTYSNLPTGDGGAFFNIITATQGAGAAGSDAGIKGGKTAVFSPLKADGTAPNNNYQNGWRSAGYNWTTAASPSTRGWSLNRAGGTMEFEVVVSGTTLTMTVDGVKYAAYTVSSSAATGDTSFGFMAQNLNVTISDLAFTELKVPANGDASIAVPGTTVRLEDAEKKNPTPQVWQEGADGSLTYTKKGYNAIFFDTGKVLPEKYTLSGKVTYSNLPTGDGGAFFNIIAATQGAGAAGSDAGIKGGKTAVFSPLKADGTAPNNNYQNGWRSAGYNWTTAASPSTRGWSLNRAGGTLEFEVLVSTSNGTTTMTMTVDGTEYAAYTVSASAATGDTSFGFMAQNLDVTISDLSLTEIVTSANGSASTIIEGATIRVEDAEHKNPTPIVWKEQEDGSLVYTKKGYNAIFYDTGKALPANYKIAGKATYSNLPTGDGGAFFNIIAATSNAGVNDSTGGISNGKTAVFAPLKADGTAPNNNYKNGWRSKGYNWTTAASPSERKWSLSRDGGTLEFEVLVVTKNDTTTMTMTVNGVKYDSYQVAATMENNTAFGFMAQNLNVTITDLVFAEVEISANGTASTIIDDATIRFEDAEHKNPTPTAWEEQEDGSLIYTKTGYNAIFYDTGKALPANYKIAGKATYSNLPDGDGGAFFNIIAATSNAGVNDSTGGISNGKTAVFAPLKADGTAPNLNYKNGWRSAGYNWTANTPGKVETGWKLERAGGTLEFEVVVSTDATNVTTMTMTVNGVKYDPYQVATTMENNTAFGFMAQNLNVTITDLVFAEVEPPVQPYHNTEAGDASAIFEGTTIRLDCLHGLAEPGYVNVGAWREYKDGSLVYKKPTNSNYDAILFETEAGTFMPESYEISGTLTVDKNYSDNSKLAIIFGAYDLSADCWQNVALATGKGDLNHRNGFYPAGISWTSNSNEPRNWTLPADGESVEFILTVNGKIITLSLDGEVYDSYTLRDEMDFTGSNICFGFYADSLDATLSDLYYGEIKNVIQDTLPSLPDDEEEENEIPRYDEDTDTDSDTNADDTDTDTDADADKDDTTADEQSPVTGETVGLLTVIALLMAVAAGGVLLALRRKEA